MKFFIIAILFACLIAPIFGQDAYAEVYQSLNESMGTSISHSTESLENFDRQIVHENQGKVYASYKIRYQALSRALQESEITMERLIRFQATPAHLRDERNRYESLLRQLENLRSDYDTWLRNTQ